MARRTYWPTINRHLYTALVLMAKYSALMAARTAGVDSQFATDTRNLQNAISTYIMTYGVYREPQ